MTIEEKAKEYAEETILALYSDSGLMQDFVQKLKKYAKVDFLAGYNEAMRWRDPKETPQDEDLLVKYQIGDVTHDFTCLEKDCNDTWHWRGRDWDVDEYPIIAWRPIE